LQQVDRRQIHDIDVLICDKLLIKLKLDNGVTGVLERLR
jgi:hypothetical protein